MRLSEEEDDEPGDFRLRGFITREAENRNALISDSIAPKVLLHGSGAIGSIYVYLLSQAGYDITAVCRSNYNIARKRGFTIGSELWEKKGLTCHPNVVKTPQEAAEQGEFDYIIVTTKAIPEAETSKIIAPAVTKCKTCIVLIHNGIGIEEEYAEAFPENPLLTCVVLLPSTQVEPGYMKMGKFEALEIGTFPSSAYKDQPNVKEATDTFVDMMQKAGSNAKFFADVQENRWKKVMVNGPWNPTCAITLSTDVAFLTSSPEANALMQSMMVEIVRIAQALDDTAIQQLQRAKGRIGTRGIEPSMLVDRLNDRRMEVGTILGNPVRIAKKLGVDVPKLELLYGLAKSAG